MFPFSFLFIFDLILIAVFSDELNQSLVTLFNFLLTLFSPGLKTESLDRNASRLSHITRSPGMDKHGHHEKIMP